MTVLRAAETLREAVDAFPAGGKVDYVYNPLRYAWSAHRAYATRYGAGKRRVVFVGMNPGPWGMGQTGVPFGDVQIVREWMGIEEKVDRPLREHAKRPVLGFASTRREPSGSRLWGWARERYGAAEAFFRERYVLNYCPLLFYDEDGKNLTPPELSRAQTDALYAACDRHVVDVVAAMQPDILVGVGDFARGRLADLVAREGLDVRVGSVLHPSPASPRANRGWAEQAEKQLQELGAL